MRARRHVLMPCLAIFVAVGSFIWWRQYVASPRPTPRVEVAASHHRKPAAPRLPAMSLAPSSPIEVRITKLGIAAPVEPAGINSSGEMADPQNATDATWYKYGYLPGAFGNAVLAGHYLYKSKPALFYRLHELAPGDVVSVVNDQQNVIDFRVTASQHFTAEDAPFTEIFGASKKAQLRLVTCYGAWDKARQRYAERLVVTAEFVAETTSTSAERSVYYRHESP